VWQDAELFARLDQDYGHTSAEARAFLTTLAEQLSLETGFCIPGYEDAWYHLWRERRLPANVDPLDNRLDDPEERRRLTQVFEQGLKHVVGFALPLRRRFGRADSRWESGPWFLRQEHLFLIPGDSPMGYRLPLDSLPWEAPGDLSQTIPQATFAPRGPLPMRTEFVRQIHQRNGQDSPNGRAPLEAPRGPHPWNAVPPQIVRTALCVEPRDGRLHVFMPPVETIEDYLELVTAIEATAADLSLPVLLEGYQPPSDHRLNHFQITPDPGVIEVNTHPAHDWDELVETTTTLYEEARLSRLCTEKFMLDGRHCGTGGGNHIVIGGPTPADSPILRRPDLLRSLLACWHNHPSLSYLFSSLFVGPTSQAPRLDEARNDSLYELEIAFRQIPDHGCPPWLVDRAFRNLLTDVTGNTHRAEFCIDKLYPPESDEGRRGLVEFRAFEMPPHARMSLVQQLLMRALIARFWETPYRHKLARWGTELHDRFLLPHFVAQDFDDLLHELHDAGYPVDKDWFAAHFEFRFPLLGSVTLRGLQLELRQAIEPWHVLGEESGTGGTARYVDSSVERLEVKVRGLTDVRHVVTCNGHRLPLSPTGTNGEFVAGVRYRAWQPPACLHPTIPVHTPLVFDIYDTWNSRSIGGCQYHVMHQGGRAFETFPVNATEAETRRHSRFFPFGHSPRTWTLLPLEVHPECPLTLDLRTKAPLPPAPVATAERIEVSGPSVAHAPRSHFAADEGEENGLVELARDEFVHANS
jgi:uncharacterized protein (DUF2126 family)